MNDDVTFSDSHIWAFFLCLESACQFAIACECNRKVHLSSFPATQMRFAGNQSDSDQTNKSVKNRTIKTIIANLVFYCLPR